MSEGHIVPIGLHPVSPLQVGPSSARACCLRTNSGNESESSHTCPISACCVARRRGELVRLDRLREDRQRRPEMKLWADGGQSTARAFEEQKGFDSMICVPQLNAPTLNISAVSATSIYSTETTSVVTTPI